MHRVEKLGRAGGFHRKPGKAGDKGSEGRDIPGRPALAQHIAPAEIQDEDQCCHGDNPVNGRQGGAPDIGPDGGALVGGKIFLVSGHTFRLAAEDPVGDRVGGAIEGGGA